MSKLSFKAKLCSCCLGFFFIFKLSKGQFSLLIYVKKIKNKKLLAYPSGSSPTFLVTSIGLLQWLNTIFYDGIRNSSQRSFQWVACANVRPLAWFWWIFFFSSLICLFSPWKNTKVFFFIYVFNLVLIIFIANCFAFDACWSFFFNFIPKHFIPFNFCIQFWSSFILLLFFLSLS